MGRSLTYLQDFIGGISTYLSIIAGIINLIAWATNGSDDSMWMAVWITELAWSGFIESSAIALVFKTDSNLLRKIGGFSMVGVNTTSIILINLAQQSDSSWQYVTVFILHGIALGQALDIWIGTFIVDHKTGLCRMMNTQVEAATEK